MTYPIVSFHVDPKMANMQSNSETKWLYHFFPAWLGYFLSVLWIWTINTLIVSDEGWLNDDILSTIYQDR